MPQPDAHSGRGSSAFRLFRILVRARIRMLRNSFRTATPTHKLIITILLGFGAMVFAGIGVGCAGLALIMQADAPIGAPLTPAASGLVSHVYQYLFFFLLAGSVPYVASSLFQDNDLPLLLTTPAPSASVVAAKMVDAVVANSSQFMVLGVPILLGLWWGIKLSPEGWAWCAVSLLLLLLVTPLLSACLLLILARLFGMKRVRFVVMIVSIILALSITLVAVAGASKATAGGSMNYRQVRMVLMENAQTRTTDIRQAVAHSTVDMASTGKVSVESAGNVWLPSTWAAAVALDGASFHEVGRVGRQGIGLLVAGVLGLFALCVLIGDRVLSSETILEQSDLESFGRRKSGRTFAIPGLSRRVAGLLLKDFRYVGRDTILLGQIGTTLILFLVPFVLKATQPAEPDPRIDTYGDLTKLMLVLIVFMITSIIGLSSVGLEGKGVWMMLSSPMARRDFLQSKWILSFVLSFGIVVALTSISSLVFGWEMGAVVQWLGLLACGCYALTGLSVGLGGLFPRFLYDNPAHRASIWAMILGFVFATAYVVISVSLFLVAWLAFGRELPHANMIAMVGVVLFVVLTLSTGIMPMRLAERRLIEYEWES